MLDEYLHASGYQTFGSSTWHDDRDRFARSFSAEAEIFRDKVEY